jgi:regulator of RNase E activity RraA
VSEGRKLTGRVPREAIARLEFPRLAPDTLRRFAALEDLTGTASDSLDALGLRGAIPAAVLAPSLPERRLVGQAVTVRNVERDDTPSRAASEGKGRMGEHEAYNLALPGDVVVIEGLTGASNLGGQSAALAHRSGVSGAVVDGSYRDPQAARALGFPIWSRGVTPITGKWRLQTVGINGRVRIAGVSVDAGDLVLADEAGIVFVPFAQVDAVLAHALRIDEGDARQRKDIEAGVDLAQIARTRYK